MEECDTPEKLAAFLQKCGISSDITQVLVEDEIVGEDFLDLTQEDLIRLKIKTGPIKRLLKIKKKHDDDQKTVDWPPPKETPLTLAVPLTTTHYPVLSPHPTARVQSMPQEIPTQEVHPIIMAKPQPMDQSSAYDVQQSQTIPGDIPNQQVIPMDIPLCKKIIGFCTEIKSEPGPPQVFKLPLMTKPKVGTDVVWCQVGMKDQSESICFHPQRYVMVVGATGAGKTTLINGMANYLLGTEWKDNFRFKLVTNDDEGGEDQAKSKTVHVTAYHFPKQKGSKVPYSLTIIDTPGFGDTGGLEKDKRTFEKIHKLFMNAGIVDQIDAIGFVAQSSQGRLTPTQNYIFNRILSIFGKDVGDNIFLMTTFADAHRPPVLDAVNKAKINIQNHFKFNNSALFASNTQASKAGSQRFDEMFWVMGMESFAEFFNHLSLVQSQSLLQTRQVLVEREQLQNLVEGLQPQINLGLTKIDEFRQEERIVKSHEAEIEKSKDFRYEVKVQKQKVVDLQGQGIYTTNCLQCCYTCHNSCKYRDDSDKAKCCAMGSNGYCEVCPQKCKWDQHRNTPYRYEWYTDAETRTSANLQQRYNVAQSGKSKVQQIMESLEQDLRKTHEVVLQMICKTKDCLTCLQEIALKPNTLTEVDYVDTLIQAEEEQCQEGFRDRVKALKEVRKQAELLSTMSQAQVEEYMKKDHKTFFTQFQPKPAAESKGMTQKLVDAGKKFLFGTN